MAEEGLTLSRPERELQTWVAEQAWPADSITQYEIMERIDGFMTRTGASQRRTAAIVGWPPTTMFDRTERFRRSEDGQLPSARTKPSGENTAEVKRERAAKKVKAIRAAKEEVKAVIHDPEARDLVLHELDLASDRERAIADRDKTLVMLIKFRALHRQMTEVANAVLSGNAVIHDDERDALLQEVGWLKNACELIESGLRAGTLEDALAGWEGGTL